MRDLPNLPGLARHGADVRRAFVRAVGELGWNQDQGDALAAVIEHESGWRATAVNPASGATGLIQFMPRTAQHLGTSVAALRAMDEIGQLPFVVKYFRPLGPLLAPRDVPVAGYLPSLVGYPDDWVTFKRGSTGYRQNAGLDVDKDGAITLGEVREHALRPLVAAASRPRLPIDDAPFPSEPKPPTVEPASGSGGAALVGLLALGLVLAKRWAS